MVYQQETELDLLTQFLRALDDKRVIDVGAERGGFVEELLQADAEAVYAVEPYPPSVAVLRDRFGKQPAVHILEMALGERDETVMLQLLKDKTGQDNDSLHTIVPVSETPLFQPVGELAVQCRTLHGLIDEGVIPAEVGILKIDAERNDFAILRGMGTLVSAVVMLEFWDDLPQSVGATPYRVDEVAAFMGARGYSNFVLVKRHDEFEVVQMNHAFTRPGDWGNIIFIHDGSFDKLSALIYTAVQEAQTRLIDKAEYYHSECQKRLVVIEEQRRAIAANESTLVRWLRMLKARYSSNRV